MADEKKEIAFEDALQELEKLIAVLENGKAPLDESLEAFEKGVKLVSVCKKHLDEAEQRVKILTENGSGTLNERDFECSEA